MACTYIIYSKITDKFYTGSTREDSPVKRIDAHNKGTTRSTKHGRPWILAYEEKYGTYTEARRRELFLKTGVGRSWIKENVQLEK